MTAEYVYRFESVRAFDPSKKADPEDMKISALAMSGDGQLLVLERTPNAARLYLADHARGDEHPRDALGRRRDPAEPGSRRQPGCRSTSCRSPRRWRVDLTPLPGVPGKLEGLAILDPSTIVVANDNDFDIGKFDKKGDNDGKGDKSQIVTVEPAAAAPLGWDYSTLTPEERRHPSGRGKRREGEARVDRRGVVVQP